MSISHANLASLWKLDDTGWEDSGPNGYALGNTNGVTVAPGILADAAVFDAVDNLNQRLFWNDASGAGLRVPAATSFDLFCWVNPNSVDLMGLMAKAGSNSLGAFPGNVNNFEYVLELVDDGTVAFAISDNSTASKIVSTDTYNAGAWNLIRAYYDHPNNLLGLQINGGTILTATPAGGVWAGSKNFQLGKWGVSSISSFWLDGMLDECGIFIGRVLSTSEASQLWNGGLGFAYPWVDPSHTLFRKTLSRLGTRTGGRQTQHG